jgi:hypothetical protein
MERAFDDSLAGFASLRAMPLADGKGLVKNQREGPAH